jgi:hypothetical protein
VTGNHTGALLLRIWLRLSRQALRSLSERTTRERGDGLRAASAFTEAKRAGRGLKPWLMRVVLSAHPRVPVSILFSRIPAPGRTSVPKRLYGPALALPKVRPP